MSRDVTSGAPRAAHVLGCFHLCPDAINAAWRAALVARELGVAMRLLHHGEHRDGGPPGAALESFIADAGQRLGVQVEPLALPRDAAAGCVASATDGLLVVASPRRHGLRERLLGGAAERLARMAWRSGVPVLVVKQPARVPYRQLLVAVDLEPGSEQLLAAAQTLCRGARTAVFHAVPPTAEVLLRELEAPPAAWRAHRDERERSARARLERLIAEVAGGPAAGRAASLVASVGFGPPAGSVLGGEARHQAELLVIGRRRRGPLADLLPGGVTRQVIARSRADVLVWPLRPQPAPAPAPAPAPEPGRSPQPSWSFLPRRAAKG